MASVKVNLSALEDILRSDEVKAVLVKAAEIGAERARELVPVDTGELKKSIYSEYDPATNKSSFGARKDYAGYVEFGTSKMQAQPFLRPAIDQIRKELG